MMPDRRPIPPGGADISPRGGQMAPPPIPGQDVGAGGAAAGDTELIRQIVREEMDILIAQIPGLVAQMVGGQVGAREGAGVQGELGKLMERGGGGQIPTPRQPAAREEPRERGTRGRPPERR